MSVNIPESDDQSARTPTPCVQDIVISAMQQSQTFGDSHQLVEMIETHISYVFLAGEYVYKIKKSVDFGFLNYTSLARRKHYCEVEVRLNQRLAPELYIGVVRIFQDRATGEITLDQTLQCNDVVEYAVKMHRFDQASILTQWMKSQSRLKQQMVFQSLGRCIAEFHLITPRISTSSALEKNVGGAGSIRLAVEQNFERILPLLSDQRDIGRLQHLSEWSQSELRRLSSIFSQRLADGFVRECHGDLHTGNIAIIDGQPLLFDCIEFNDQFRCIDVMSEVAFLVMDLEAMGAKEEAVCVLNAYIARTGDYEGLRLLIFYKLYRAMVRAKVAILRLAHGDLSAEEKSSVLTLYNRYVDLAISYVEGLRSGLLLTHGVSGSGKTTAARYLAQHWGAIHVRSDIERKRLFGLKELESSKKRGIDIYTVSATERTFDQLQKITQLLLETGMRVVLDSTFLHVKARSRFFGIAQKTRCPVHIVSCQLSDPILRQRLRFRQEQDDDASEAGISIMEQQKMVEEPLTAWEQEKTFAVDMCKGEEALELILPILKGEVEEKK